MILDLTGEELHFDSLKSGVGTLLSDISFLSPPHQSCRTGGKEHGRCLNSREHREAHHNLFTSIRRYLHLYHPIINFPKYCKLGLGSQLRWWGHFMVTLRESAYIFLFSRGTASGWRWQTVGCTADCLALGLCRSRFDIKKSFFQEHFEKNKNKSVKFHSNTLRMSH